MSQRDCEMFNAGAAATGATIDRLRDALRKAGEWVAAVDPKPPMPGVGDSQQYVLDMIEDALTAVDSVPPMSPATLGRKGGKAGTGASKRRGDSAYYKALRAKVRPAPGGSAGG